MPLTKLLFQVQISIFLPTQANAWASFLTTCLTSFPAFIHSYQKHLANFSFTVAISQGQATSIFLQDRHTLAGFQESLLARIQSVLHIVAKVIFWKHKLMFHCSKLGFFCLCALNKSLILQSQLQFCQLQFAPPVPIQHPERELSFTTLPHRFLIILCVWLISRIAL